MSEPTLLFFPGYLPWGLGFAGHDVTESALHLLVFAVDETIVLDFGLHGIRVETSLFNH